VARSAYDRGGEINRGCGVSHRAVVRVERRQFVTLRYGRDSSRRRREHGSVIAGRSSSRPHPRRRSASSAHACGMDGDLRDRKTWDFETFGPIASGRRRGGGPPPSALSVVACGRGAAAAARSRRAQLSSLSARWRRASDASVALQRQSPTFPDARDGRRLARDVRRRRRPRDSPAGDSRSPRPAALFFIGASEEIQNAVPVSI